MLCGKNIKTVPAGVNLQPPRVQHLPSEAAKHVNNLVHLLRILSLGVSPYRGLSFSLAAGAVGHLQPMRSCYSELHKGFHSVSVHIYPALKHQNRAREGE